MFKFTVDLILKKRSEFSLGVEGGGSSDRVWKPREWQSKKVYELQILSNCSTGILNWNLHLEFFEIKILLFILQMQNLYSSLL